MFEEPSEIPSEQGNTPEARAREKADELFLYAELFAVFEGMRKTDAQLRADLPADTARRVQQAMGRLAKSKIADTPVIQPEHAALAAEVLNLPNELSLATNDYHIHRRPGEVMIVRWLTGKAESANTPATGQVDNFYERLQAHYSAALEGVKDDEQSDNAWKNAEGSAEFLQHLEKMSVPTSDKYLRKPLAEHRLHVLSTHAADAINIVFLAEDVMGITPAQVVGKTSAPPGEDATEEELSWYYKLFSLRGNLADEERMCFFAYLQKADDVW